MKSGRKKQVLTEKESFIMNMLWEHGPLFVRELVELYPEPRPHFNTVATTVRILEKKGICGARSAWFIASILRCCREEYLPQSFARQRDSQLL